MNELTYLQCHAVRHDWDEVSVTKEPRFGMAFDYRCTNCYAIKREIFSRMSGVLLSRWYKLPHDYRGPAGTTKADYRKVWLQKKFREQTKRSLKVVN